MKTKRVRKTFLQRLTEKLDGFGNVHSDRFNDGSSSWVEIKKGGFTLNISFDDKGETITDIGIYKDIVQVVDQERIWMVKK